jgi:Mor family transcriptional regulator
VIHAPVDEIVRVIGLPATLALIERFGGTAVYLPHPSRVKPESPLAELLGMELACRLASEWPQCEIKIPLALERLRRERNRAIRAERLTVREIARKYGLTMRTVERIRAQADEDEPEPTTRSAGAAGT